MKKKRNNILFISDSSITNPIVHSQGLPLLQSQQNKSFFISFEARGKSSFQKFYKDNISDRFPNIIFNPIFVKGILPFGLENILFGIFKTLSLFIRKDISIIHARSFVPTLIAIVVKMILLGRIFVIYDNRGLVIEEEISKNNWNKNSFKINLLKGLQKKMILKADKIVVVSNYFKTYLLELNSIDAKKIVVIPNGTKITNSPLTSRDKGEFKVVYSGSSSKWQKINLVLELFEKIIQYDNNIKCTILTYNNKEIIELVKASRLEGHVDVLTLDSSLVFNELSKHNIALLLRDNNIVNNVASPLKFAEYLNAGLPLLISRGIGDTESIIKKHNIGKVTDNNSLFDDFLELKKLVDTDKNIYDRCRKVAREEFNIEKSIETYNRIYSEINS